MKKLDLHSSTVLLRDQFLRFDEANVSVASAPVLYGLCIYTVFSAIWNVEEKQLYMFRLKDHYQRLIKSARIMDFQDFAASYPYEFFQKLMIELLKCNEVNEDALVRVMVFVDEISAGTKIRGLKNALTAYVYPLGEMLPLKGIHACVSSWQRTSDGMIPARAKVNGSYINASLMKNEALLNGYDDAIALDSSGHVAESSVSNLFLVRDGILITPHEASDILEGITRNTILSLAEDMRIPHEQRTVDRTELYIADEIMLVGSSVLITPILKIDYRQVGTGAIGPITERLMQRYYVVQRDTDTKFTHWCLPVYAEKV